jgi:hypothetical protein
MNSVAHSPVHGTGSRLSALAVLIKCPIHRWPIGRDWKGKLSPVLYVCWIVSTLPGSWVPQVLYVAAALMWLCMIDDLKSLCTIRPDRQFERTRDLRARVA